MKNSAALAVSTARSTKRNSIWFKSYTFDIGLILLLAIFFIACFPGLFTHFAPSVQDQDAILTAPSSQHIFGTDNYGRDLFSRILWGTRIDLEIGILAVVVPFLTGSLIGLVTGYYGKWVDTLFMRILDIFMAFPFTILVIAIVAIMGSGIRNLYIAIWLVGWKEYARLVRSETIVIKNSEYVEAAKTLGYSDLRILFRHILPNAINSSLVYAISDIMMCILVGASLSFLGLGVQPPTPEWGAIISEGREYISAAWWLCAFPGLALAVTGISFSLLGDGLCELLNIKEH